MLASLEQAFVNKYGELAENKKYLKIRDADSQANNIHRTNFAITYFNEH
jgi:hypothetical protein